MSKALIKLNQRMEKVDSLVSVGLDADVEKLPERFLKLDHPQFEFNKWIIDQSHEFVCAYKPNIAFYEANGEAGWRSLRLTMEYLRANYPDIFTICDAKRADIGNTNRGYVSAIFDRLGFDAITLHPFLGREALAPFLEREDKVSIILCRTSNPGSGELQDLVIKSEIRNPKSETNFNSQNSNFKNVWRVVAEMVSQEWNSNNNCMLVVGATYPEELAQVRQIVGDMPLLIPGIGAQGGDVGAVIKTGLNSQGQGMVINSARGIIFAEDPGKEARELKEEINKYR